MGLEGLAIHVNMILTLQTQKSNVDKYQFDLPGIKKVIAKCDGVGDTGRSNIK